MVASGLGGATTLGTWEGEPKDVLGSPRQAMAEDRYAMARGCYAVGADGGGYIARDADGFAATAPSIEEAEPFFFQATDLGSYLLYDVDRRFLAGNEGAVAEVLYELQRSGVEIPDGPWGSGGTVRPGEIAGGVSAEHAGDITQHDYVTEHINQTAGDEVVPANGPDEALPAESTDEALDEIARSEANQGRAESVVAAARPSELADWAIEGPVGGPYKIVLPIGEDRTEQRDKTTDVELAVADGALVLVGQGEGDTFTFSLTEGCTKFPEIEVNVDGDVVGGVASFQEVRGLIDLHLHMMAFEFIGGRSRCGRPWHRYGPEYALKDCPDHEPGGFGAALEGVLSNGSPDGRHNTDGWPTFAGWPEAGSLTHEQVYYRWFERAWRGGLRLVTNLLVDNNQLCKIYPFHRNSCNEMDGVRLQAQRMRELERYIDAQSGGPGEGWFRIVTDPFEAREVINSGKLAMILGIEVSRLFDCSAHPAAPKCTPEIVEERLEEVYDLGVRQMELVNKFDNQFSGVTGDSGTAGPVVNVGNFGETGSWYRLDDCESFHEEYPHSHGAADKTHMNVHDNAFGGADEAEPFTGRDGIFAAVIDTVHEHTGTPLNPAPVYPGGPHCNRVGLTELGKVLITKMAEKGIIFDPDHMSVRARYAAMDYLANTDEALYDNPKFHGLPYSGVASSHSWSDDGIYQKILELGGVVTPAGDDADDFVREWETHRGWFDDRYFTGFGFGSDTNGFSAHGGRSPVSYPISGFGGATIDKQYSGPAPDPGSEPIGKTYDLNTDGVDHYGLFPDWLESGRLIADQRQAGGGSLFWDDMFKGAEAYLQMWERAIGVPPDSCRPDVSDLHPSRIARLKKGMSYVDVLWDLGQPSSRLGHAFTYCSKAGTSRLEFTPEGALSGWKMHT